MKKIRIFFAALLSIAILLSACNPAGGDNGGPGSSPTPSPSISPQPEPTLPPTDPDGYDDSKDYSGEVVSPDELIIYPAPRGIYYNNDKAYEIQSGKLYIDPQIEERAYNKLLSVLGAYVSVEEVGDKEQAQIKVSHNSALHEQGYSLFVDEDGVTIEYKDGPGAFYAAITLDQIMAQKGTRLPHLAIKDDHPDMLSRGFSLDIARDRVPTLETLKGLVDNLAMMKMNLLSLYMEKSSMIIEELAYLQEGLDVLTESEMRQLVQYAKERYVEIMPMHSLFGHMTDWLRDDRLRDLREVPNQPNCSTICVQNPDSQEFIRKVIKSLAENFESEYIYVGGDETYEIGSDQSLTYLPGASQAKVYFESLKTIYDIVASFGKKMVIAGDMLLKYFDTDEATVRQYCQQMPDMKVYVWGYSESTDFRKFCSTMVSLGVDYGVMPSTCVFGSVAGRLTTAEINQENAIKYGITYKTTSLLTTTWGDGGMRSSLVSEYPALSYAAGMAWSYQTNNKKKMSYEPFVQRFILRTQDKDFFDAFIKLQRYNDYSTQSYGQAWLVGIANKAYFDEAFIKSYINLQNGANKTAKYAECISQMDKIIADANNLKALLSVAEFDLENEQTVKNEIEITADQIILMAEYVKMRVQLISGQKTEQELKEKAAQVHAFGLDVNRRYREYWMQSNKYSLLESSIAWMNIPMFLFGNIGEVFTAREDGNLFLLTPDDIDTLDASWFTASYVWNSYGKGLPLINIAGGTISYQEIIAACEDGSLSLRKPGQGSPAVFAMDCEKLYLNRPVAMVGWPMVTNGKTSLQITCKVKFDSGKAVTSSDLAISIVATKEDGLITLNGGTFTLSSADADGWQTLTFTIQNPSAYKYASWSIRPATNAGDTLLICNLRAS